jgi:hypothetical protein
VQRGCDAAAFATVGVQTRSGERRFGLCRRHYEDATTPCAVDGCRMVGEFVIALGTASTEEVRFCADHWQRFQDALAERGPRRAWPARGAA